MHPDITIESSTTIAAPKVVLVNETEKYIFWQKFRNGKNLPKRYEAHRDDIIMKEVAEMLGFSSVKFFPNCTRAQMISKLSEGKYDTT